MCEILLEFTSESTSEFELMQKHQCKTVFSAVTLLYLGMVNLIFASSKGPFCANLFNKVILFQEEKKLNKNKVAFLKRHL